MRMRFHRHDDFQRRSADSTGDYDRRIAAYRAYLLEVESLLSPSMHEFAARESLHDEVIRRVCWTGERRLELLVTSLGQVVFGGVQSTDLDWRAIDQVILAHEVHPTKNGAADVVLLTDEHEFFVTASVTSIRSPQSKTEM